MHFINEVAEISKTASKVWYLRSLEEKTVLCRIYFKNVNKFM